MTDKVKENIEKTKAGAHSARLSPFSSVSEDVYLHFLNSYGKASSDPSSDKHLKSGTKVLAPFGPQCRGARCKALNFSLASLTEHCEPQECCPSGRCEASSELQKTPGQDNLPELIDDTTADEHLQASLCSERPARARRDKSETVQIQDWMHSQLKDEENDNTDDDISSDEAKKRYSGSSTRLNIFSGPPGPLDNPQAAPRRDHFGVISGFFSGPFLGSIPDQFLAPFWLHFNSLVAPF